MISTPGLAIVFEHVRGHSAHRRAPARAISGSITNDHIWRSAEVWPFVNRRRVINGAYPNFSRIVITEPGQLGDQLVFQSGSLFSVYNTLRFPASEIQIQTPEAERVGARATPVDSFEVLRSLRPPRFEREVSMLM